MNLCNLVGRYIKIGFTQKMNLVLIEFVIFNLLVSICAWLKWSVGSGNSNTIISDQGTFTGYSGVYTYGVISGPTSNSLYYMHYIEIPSDYIFIRKIYSNDTVAWMSGILLWPFMKSLAVDKNENHVYVASNDNPINVWRLLGSNGAISDAQTL